MESYHLLTLNTSSLGETLLPSNSDTSSRNPFSNLLNSIGNTVSDTINDKIGDTREKLGIQDFYSAHMLDYCYGQYTPEEKAGNGVKQEDIKKKVEGCSTSKAMYRFDPTAIVQKAIEKSGLPITLKDLKWPEDIQDGIDTLNTLLGAVFVLYVLSISLIFAALVASGASVLTAGRVSACVNVVVSTSAFLAMGIASALVTAVMVKGTNVVNDKGSAIGLEAKRGNKFLALTWAATALMFLVVVEWVVEVGLGRKQKVYAKHG